MSVATEITRLQTAKANLKTSIEAKGVTVSSSALIDAYPAYVDAISTGGGSIVPEKDVNFYDWDGTLLYSYTLAQAQSLSALPELPTGPTGYTAQSWTETLSFINNLTTIWNVGVNYTANNRHSNFYITTSKPDTKVFISVGDYTIDWGSLDITTGTEGQLNYAIYHAAGDYVIRIDKGASSNTYNITTEYYGSANKPQSFIFDEDHYAAFDYADYNSTTVFDLVRKVELGNGLRRIASGAFKCMNTKSLVLPTSLDLSISQNLFISNAVKHITIPSNAGISGINFFYGSYFLESVVVPSSTKISSTIYMYEYCSKLRRAFLPSVNGTIDLFRGCISLEETVENLGNFTELGFNYHNSNSCLRSITIPAGVTTIGSRAFERCSSVKSVTIPSSVQSIDQYAFSECRSLERVVLENGIGDIGAASAYSRTYIFSACSLLKEIDIPNSVAIIGGYCFNNCVSLKKVTIGTGISTIQSNSFYNCTSLDELYIKATTPPSLGSNAFSNTPIASRTGTIYVPVSAVDTYKQTAAWSSYNIEAAIEITDYKSLTLSTTAQPQGMDEYVSATATLTCDAVDLLSGQTLTDLQIPQAVSCYIGPNTTSVPVTKTISYTWPDSGLTATTTVVQDAIPSVYVRFTPESIATGWQTPDDTWPGASYRLPDDSGYTSYIKSYGSSATNSCYLDIEFKGHTDITIYAHCHASEFCYIKLDSMVDSTNYDYRFNQGNGTTSANATNINDPTQWQPVTYSGLDPDTTHHIYAYQVFSPQASSYGQYCASIAVADNLLI